MSNNGADDDGDDDAEPMGSQDGSPELEGVQPDEEYLAAADEIVRGAQMRIECAKVCSPAQMADLVDGAQAAAARVNRLSDKSGLKRIWAAAKTEHAALLHQWQQRSGMIRTVVRVRPPVTTEHSSDSGPAVKTLPGGVRCRGLSVSVERGGRPEEVHRFKRFDYVLGPDSDQTDVFNELKAMLPTVGPGGLSGPPQSSCILAYGQTGSGKTHTMHGGTGGAQGLVPRVLVEVFRLCNDGEASISMSAVEIYNDIAYDLLDGASARSNSDGIQGNPTRGFSVGRAPPPAGLDFRLGCANALQQTTAVVAGNLQEAHALLQQAAERRSTRSTMFNATSSRSHSLVFLHAYARGSAEPSLRIAFVDLAGSERLLTTEVGGCVAEESKHINLSLSSLGSVIHSLRHRANHLPYRACLLTRLLEPYFGTSGRVLLCVCIAPEKRHAPETLCSLAFADRASRAVLGADSAQEVQRNQALAAVREAHAEIRAAIKQLLPAAIIGGKVKQRLPDGVAGMVISFVQEHGELAFVCHSWARMCKSVAWWGRELQQRLKLAQKILQWVDSPMEAATVCRCWWRAVGAYRVVCEASSAKVIEASAGTTNKLWAPASARKRADMWKALLSAGGGSGERGAWPLRNVRECVIAGSPKYEALQHVLSRCSQLRVVEVPNPDLVPSACAGLVQCSELRALKCAIKSVPFTLNLKNVLHSCRQLTVLTLTGTSDMHCSLKILAAELPKVCNLKELAVERAVADWSDMELLSKSCKRLRTFRLPYSFVDPGDSPLSPPPLVPLARLKHLSAIDFRSCVGRAYKQRSWLTDDMFGIVQRLRQIREVRLSDQKLLTDHCFWFIRKHAAKLRVLHLNGCSAMSGDSVFSFLARCDRLESLRLPQLVVGQSEGKLAVGTNRWCQGLRCPRLQELSTDSWPSLEDSGLQVITAQCKALRTVALRQAPRLSIDAVTYLVTLPSLTNLCLANCAGLTDEALKEFQSATKLRCLDMSGCRQLTPAAVAQFGAAIAAPGGPPVQSIRMDSCHNLGRETAEAFASNPKICRCSLSSCRPMPEAATFWEDARGRAEACRALGIEATTEQEAAASEDALDGSTDEDAKLPGFEKSAREADNEHSERGGLCAMCLDEIGPDDAAWECPVCLNRLHDTDDCARGWLRLKQSCPTCRAAAWAPPEDSAPSLTRAPHSRHRPIRAASVDAIAESGRRPRTPSESPAGFPQIVVNAFRPMPRPAAGSSEHIAPRPRENVADGGSWRPPRPSPAGTSRGGPMTAGRHVPAQGPAASRARSRSLPSRHADSGSGLGSFALVGSAIVGSA